MVKVVLSSLSGHSIRADLIISSQKYDNKKAANHLNFMCKLLALFAYILQVVLLEFAIQRAFADT